jgi:hypothetical protein
MFGAGALGSAMAFGLLMLGMQLWKPTETLPRPSAGSVERLVAHATAFRPDLAIGECTDALKSAKFADRAKLESLQEEFRWMEMARGRVIDAIDQTQPRLRLANFRTRTQSVPDVEILKATNANILLFANGRPQEFPWEDVTPDQIFELVDRCVPALAPAESLGLAIYAKRAGLGERARKLFASVRGTNLEEVGRRYE